MKAALVLLLFGAPASAAQFHVPTTLPPHPSPAERDDFTLRLAGGYGGVQGPGMRLAGPGGHWEFAGRGEGGLGWSARGGGFLLSGEMDPFGAGRRRTLGGAGFLAADALWPRGSGLTLHAGVQGEVTLLDVRDPAPVGPSGGVQPDTAASIVPGASGGALWERRAGGWLASARAYATAYPYGATFFTYGLSRGTRGASTRPVHFDAALGGGLLFGYEPARLSLELTGRASAGFGNNAPTTFAAVLLSLGAF